MNSLIKIAVNLTILGAFTGQLPKIVHIVRMAQLQLLKESKASNWGRPWTPKSNVYKKIK